MGLLYLFEIYEMNTIVGPRLFGFLVFLTKGEQHSIIQLFFSPSSFKTKMNFKLVLYLCIRGVPDNCYFFKITDV